MRHARATGFASENFIVEVTEGERVEAGVWFAKVIAEGIETPAERDFLADQGVRLMDDKVWPARG